MSVIEAAALSKRYGAVVGIEDVSFSVAEGEVFGFLGPNGAGKTTTIRLLMHLLRPDRGRLSVFGVPLATPQVALRERIGYLPGDFRPYVEMTGADFLAYMARYRSRPPVLRAGLSERLRFTPREAGRRIKHLSHGNRQKVGLLLALEHDPELAILDEPTLGLDPLMQEAFYDIVRDFRARGRTIFLSSHVLAEVEKVCDRVAMIRDGRLAALESLDVLKRRRPRRVVVDVGAGAPAPDLPGTRLVAHVGRRCTYLVERDVRVVLQALAVLPDCDVFLPEPDLEDVFMAYYGGREA